MNFAFPLFCAALLPPFFAVQAPRRRRRRRDCCQARVRVRVSFMDVALLFDQLRTGMLAKSPKANLYQPQNVLHSGHPLSESDCHIIGRLLLRHPPPPPPPPPSSGSLNHSALPDLVRSTELRPSFPLLRVCSEVTCGQRLPHGVHSLL